MASLTVVMPLLQITELIALLRYACIYFISESDILTRLAVVCNSLTIFYGCSSKCAIFSG